MSDLPPRPTDRTHDQQPQPGSASFSEPDVSGGAIDEAGPGRDSGATVGLEAGGGVSPGDTPPSAGSESEASEDRQATPNQGPVSPSRKPQIIGLVLIAILVLAVLGYGVANIIAYVTK